MKPREQVPVTVIMTCRERHALTEPALESVFRHTEMKFRLVFADVCSPAWLHKRLEQRASRNPMEIVRFDEPLWPTEVRRMLCGSIDTPYVVFMDNDVIVEPGWLENLYACAEQTGAGIVGPLYLWGASAPSRTIHMAGGRLAMTREPGGYVMQEEHQFVNMTLDDVGDKLHRETAGFAEFHCMLMRRDVYRDPATFDEDIVCVHEHIHASLNARRLGFETWVEPAARVTYLAYAPYALSELDLFRRRWSTEAGERSIHAFCKHWNVIDDERSFGGVRRFLVRHVEQVEMVHGSFRTGPAGQQVMGEADLRQSRTGLIELAMERGYPAQLIEQLDESFRLALKMSNGGYRPCGRPFISHLLGTASVLVFYGFRMPIVIAGLLHATYTHCPPTMSDGTRGLHRVAHALGGKDSECEKRVRAYTLRFQAWDRLFRAMPDWKDAATLDLVEILAMEAANDVDMHLSGEVRATGRRDVLDDRMINMIREACEIIGVPGLARTVMEQRGQSPAPFHFKPPSAQGSFRIAGGKFAPMAHRVNFAGDAAS